MSVQVIDNGEYACLMCTTTMHVFGDVFYSDKNEDPYQFLEWLPEDPRIISEPDLSSKIEEWRSLPICDWCENHTSDELRPVKALHNGGRSEYQCCDQCYELLVDEDDRDDGAIDRYREDQKNRESMERI